MHLAFLLLIYVRMDISFNIRSHNFMNPTAGNSSKFLM